MNPSEDVMLAEYSAANAVYLTYDGFRWQAGSFLIAGVFVYWGFVVSVRSPVLVVSVSSILIAALMSCWVLFAHHYRQLYLWKLARMHEIEEKLKMEQNLRFIGPERIVTRGPKGHNLDLYVYALTSLGGGLLATSRDGFSLWTFLTVPLVVIVLLWVMRNERRATADRTAYAKRVAEQSSRD